MILTRKKKRKVKKKNPLEAFRSIQRMQLVQNLSFEDNSTCGKLFSENAMMSNGFYEIFDTVDPLI